MNPAAARSYLWMFWLLAGIGLVADQASKYGIFAWLYCDDITPQVEETIGPFTVKAVPPEYQGDGWGRKVELIPNAFSLYAKHTASVIPEDEVGAALRTVSGQNRPYVNKGALFGIGGQGDGGEIANRLFAGISFFAAIAILIWSRRSGTRSDRILCLSLGLILAGTLGNLYDRLVFHGVRDFLWWYGGFNWPVFNLADCCLVCGAGLLLLHAFLRTEVPVEEAKASAEAQAVQTGTPAGGV